MGASKRLRMAMLDKDVSVVKLAEMTGKATQTVYNALAADNFKYDNLSTYANALGCDVVLLDRKTGKTY